MQLRLSHHPDHGRSYRRREAVHTQNLRPNSPRRRYRSPFHCRLHLHRALHHPHGHHRRLHRRRHPLRCLRVRPCFPSGAQERLLVRTNPKIPRVLRLMGAWTRAAPAFMEDQAGFPFVLRRAACLHEAPCMCRSTTTPTSHAKQAFLDWRFGAEQLGVIFAANLRGAAAVRSPWNCQQQPGHFRSCATVAASRLATSSHFGRQVMGRHASLPWQKSMLIRIHHPLPLPYLHRRFHRHSRHRFRHPGPALHNRRGRLNIHPSRRWRRIGTSDSPRVIGTVASLPAAGHKRTLPSVSSERRCAQNRGFITRSHTVLAAEAHPATRAQALRVTTRDLGRTAWIQSSSRTALSLPHASERIATLAWSSTSPKAVVITSPTMSDRSDCAERR